MRHIVPLISSFLLVTTAASAKQGQQVFMPKNDLHIRDKGKFVDEGLTEAQFNAVLDRADALYRPLFTQFGATFTINRLWDDETVNASAEQPSETSWVINMYGGLARRPEVTEDGFAMVVCHEIGHHLAGYPFVEEIFGGAAWAANEGQSDLYATSACAEKMFAPNLEISNRAFADLPEAQRAKCDANHADSAARDTCYRSILAGKSLADLLAALNEETVDYDTPDTSVVDRTDHAHPKAQCRLDTYIAGALCGGTLWDDALIPGKSMATRNSMDAQAEALAHSCAEGEGARPRCWFAPLTGDESECPIENPIVCAIMCAFDPSQPWCSK